MVSDSVAVTPTAAPRRAVNWGQPFVGPVFDYLVIGGGLSLLLVPLILVMPALTPMDQMIRLAAFVIFNYAHFAASTVRLYTKRGPIAHYALLAYGSPLIAFGVVTAALIWPDAIGRHLWSLYLTWSPYHYAAQAFGLAVMYCYRSRIRLSPTQKSCLWWAAMLPFAYAFLVAPDSGLRWFLPASLAETPAMEVALSLLSRSLAVVMLVIPAVIWLRVGLPLISWLLLAANGIWWLTLGYTDAWFWATLFHSAQYLGILLYVHSQEHRGSAEGQRQSLWFQAGAFYATSLLLGVLLFILCPIFFHLGGFDGARSAMMVAAAVNIHHFVVDAYIWRSPQPKAGQPAPNGLQKTTVGAPGSAGSTT